MPSSARRLVLVLAFSAAYFAVARSSLAFATLNHHASPVWPATGLAIGAVACCGGEFALGAALGSLFANLILGSPLSAVLGMTVGNGLEAWVGGTLAAAVLRRRNLFEHQSELAAVLGAALVATPISATAGAVSLAATGTIPWSSAGATWVTWWTGNALGTVVVAPFLLRLQGSLVGGPPGADPRASSAAEARSTHPLGPEPLAPPPPAWASAGLVGAVAVGLWVVFWTASDRSLLFGLFPLLLAATWLWGTWGAWLLTAVVCGAAILATGLGGGPFEAGTLNANLLSLQLFLGSVAITGLALAGFARARALRGASVVLCVGWLATGLLFRSFDTANRAREAAAFGDLVEDAEAALRHRMNLYEDALWGGVSLVHALPGLDGEDWRTYAETLDLPARYPGISGIGVVWPVAIDEEEAFVARLQAEPGNGAFHVRSVPGAVAGEARDRFVITYLEPRAPNLAAVGLDLGSEPRRREAAERARDSGKSAMTDPIELVQAEVGRPAFLLYLPIYAGTAIPDTVEARRRAHLGWVYAPFLTDQFLERALHRFEGQLEYRVYGGTDASEVAPLLDTTTSDRPASRLRQLQLAGQTLTFAWSPAPGSAGSADLTGALAGGLGALVTVLLASVVSSLQSIGVRAQTLADEQTKRLRASEERFALAVHGSHDGIWDWDLVQDQVYYSPRWKEMLGYAESLPNHFDTWSELQHPDDRDRVLAALDAYLQGASPTYEVESRLRHADGSWRWILQRGTVVRDATGRPVRMAGSHTDVTAQREAEGRVRQSEAFLQSIVENLPIMVFVKDATDLRFVRVNRAGEQVLGRDRSELLGRNDADVLPPEAARAAAEADRAVLAGQSVVAVSEERLANPGGDDRVLYTRKIPIRDESGRPRYLLGISEDVTERLRSERELRAAKEAALEGTRAKSEFLANMSHEIRTPINGIVGMGSLLAGTPLTDEQREYVDGIAKSAEGLLGIVSDILDFSKVEARRLELEAIEVTLPDVLHDVAATLRVAAETKALGFSSTCDPSVAPPRLGDPTRIRQVLLNLVSNAVKFTAAGRVDVRVLAGPGDTVRFEVDDTGVGIPEDLRGRLFQPFTQADASTTRRFGGTGLGLSISKRLVEAMGGSIGCSSREGPGTRFWFELPLPRAASTGTAPSPERAVAPRTGRILVGEDNPVSQLVTQRLLERLGHEVVVAASGDDVLAALASGPYDLILMDCQMPGRDGWETTAAIRRSGAGHQDIPIVALTANALRGDRERCLAAGMNDYLAKPYTPATLAEVVARWLREPDADPSADDGLDEVALDRLAALGEAAGSDFLAEFVGRWVSDTPPRVAAMRRASTAEDLDQLRAIAHSLKASSGFVGATGVAELCRSLEEDGAGAEVRGERLARLEQAVTLACRHLVDDLDRRRARSRTQPTP